MVDILKGKVALFVHVTSSGGAKSGEKELSESWDPVSLFRKFDIDRSGTISFTEFTELLKHLGLF